MTKNLITIFCIAFCCLIFSACKNSSTEFELTGGTILLDTINVPQIDSAQYHLIQQYRVSLEAEMHRLLVHSEHVMERGTPEGLLNNFVADLVFEMGQNLYKPQDNKPIDFCLLNYGGLRISLPRGEVTYERVFELLPFENEMVVITLSGEKTQELFNYLAESQVGMPVSGVRLTIADKIPHTILIRDENFDIKRNYKVLTSDYLAGGGDSMEFFHQPLNYELLGMRIRDAIIQYMLQTHEKGEKISSQLDGRISFLH